MGTRYLNQANRASLAVMAALIWVWDAATHPQYLFRAADR
jgi:hypothetical protein